MEKHSSSQLPGFKLKNLGRVDAEQTAPTLAAAIDAATRMVERQATGKRADAIMNFDVTWTLANKGYSSTASGMAVKKTKT